MTATTNPSIGPEHAAYVPRLVPAWASASGGLAHRELDASLVLFDISGFTRLTERLSRQGRAGAEELSDVLHAVFTPLVAIAEDEGSDLLKWGGDAVLLLVDGPGHALRAARVARGMHRVLGRVGHLRTSVGRVVLRASSGIHTGTVHLVLAGDPAVHRELMIVGPAASAVCRADTAAGPGQIVVSDATARALPSQLLGATVPAGRVLLNHPVPAPAVLPVGGSGVVPPELLTTLLPPQLRIHLTEHESEPEHRMVAAAFLRFDGADRLLDERGPHRLAARRRRADPERAGLRLPARGLAARVGRRCRGRETDATGGGALEHRRRRRPPGVRRPADRRPGRRATAAGRHRAWPGVHWRPRSAVPADVLGEGPRGEPGGPARGAGRTG